jgi:hypothetical protein
MCCGRIVLYMDVYSKPSLWQMPDWLVSWIGLYMGVLWQGVLYMDVLLKTLCVADA